MLFLFILILVNIYLHSPTWFSFSLPLIFLVIQKFYIRPYQQICQYISLMTLIFYTIHLSCLVPYLKCHINLALFFLRNTHHSFLHCLWSTQYLCYSTMGHLNIYNALLWLLDCFVIVNLRYVHFKAKNNSTDLSLNTEASS